MPGSGVKERGACSMTGAGASWNEGMTGGCGAGAAGRGAGVPNSCSLLKPSAVCGRGKTGGGVWPFQVWALVAANGSKEVTCFGATTGSGTGAGSGAGAGVAKPKLAFALGCIGPDTDAATVGGRSGPDRAAAAAFAAANGLVVCAGVIDAAGENANPGGDAGDGATSGAGTTAVCAGTCAAGDVVGRPWKSSLAGNWISTSRRALESTLRNPMSVVPSMSKPSSTLALPEAICSETVEEGIEVMIQEGTMPESKPRSVTEYPFSNVERESLSGALLLAAGEGGVCTGAGTGAGGGLKAG